ncbi:CLIP-associating protein 2-like [Neosynchiropus ocellatus]
MACGDPSLWSRETVSGVSEEDFVNAYADVPVVQIASARELERSLNKIREICSDDKHHWNIRLNGLKKIRSLVIAGAADYDCFYQHLRLLVGAFQLSAKDLRSVVVREACITVCHISSVLGDKFAHGAEAIVPVLFNLIPSTIKVMAASGLTAICIIMRHTHVPRLVPLITSNCTSKSVPVRRTCYNLLDRLMKDWETDSLERHSAVLIDSIKKGVQDPDMTAREGACNAYWSLKNHFPKDAKALFTSLEPAYQKTLISSSSQEGSQQQFSKAPTSQIQSPVYSRGRKNTKMSSHSQRSQSATPFSAGSRSCSPGRLLTTTALSTVNTGVLQRQASAGNEDPKRQRRFSRGASPTRQNSSPPSTTVSQNEGSKGARRSRIPRPSVSQSCSRNASRESSRDPSPVRSFTAISSRSFSRSTGNLHIADSFGPAGTDFGSQSGDTARYPISGINMEEALARIRQDIAGLRNHESYGVSSDNSDGSSACSERSLGSRNGGSIPSYKRRSRDKTEPDEPTQRNSEGYFINSDDSEASSACSERSSGSRNGGAIPAYRKKIEYTPEMCLSVSGQVLHHLASANWSERKKGLIDLQALLKSKHPLRQSELKRLCDLFTRMFEDPYSKLFGIFLETLVDVILVYKDEMHNWLTVLLTQLLKKMGCDSLLSVQSKLHIALDVTRESFPSGLQFNVLMQLLNGRGVSVKVMAEAVKYMELLTTQMEASDFVNSTDTQLTVSYLVNCTMECDNSETARSVLIALYQLNTTEFNMVLNDLPDVFQIGAKRVIEDHLKSDDDAAENLSSPEDISDPQGHEEEDDEASLEESLSQALMSSSVSAAPRQKTSSLDTTSVSIPHQSERVPKILKGLSSEETEEKEKSLLDLQNLINENPLQISNMHFKSMLSLLMEATEDVEHGIRILSFHVLGEFLIRNPSRFKDHAENLIMKTLEAHNDSNKQVLLEVEKTASILALSISPEKCVRLVCPVIQTADHPVNLAAIKMVTKVVERIPPENLVSLMPEIMPGLIRCFEDSDIGVRKACIYCFVAIYSVINEDLEPHLCQLPRSKLKLVRLYIERSCESSP